MFSRLVGVLVVLLAFGGCAFLGVEQMVTAQRVGGVPALALILLAGPLLLVGWLAVRIVGLFIGRWRHDYLNRTLRQRRIAGLAVAALSGGLLYSAVSLAVPSQHPGHDLTGALRVACTDGTVVGAGSSHRAGAATAHLVVLDPAGNEQAWTGFAPMEWKPASLADTELVACVSDEDVAALIETCQYINGPAIKRYSATRVVKLVEPATGRVVAEYDVTDHPRQCRSTEERDVVELNGKVAWEMVQAHLALQAGCCAPSATPSPTPRALHTERPGWTLPPDVWWTMPPMPSPAMPVEPTPALPAEPPAPLATETPVP